MASFRYLEFDSTYRDRNMYPNPAEFVVELSSSGKNGRETARDPVSNASPELYWNSSLYESKIVPYNTQIDINDVVDITYSPSATNNIIISSSLYGDVLRPVNKFYNGCIISMPESPVPDVILKNSFQIQNYKNIDTVTKEISLYRFFDKLISAIDTSINIFDQHNNSSLFIPCGQDIHNAYSNYYLQKIDISTTPPTYDTKKIVSYDGNTHNCILDSSISSWNLSNSNIIMRKELPVNYGNILEISNGTCIQLDVNSSNISGMYNGCFLRMLQPVPYVATTTTPTSRYFNEYGLLTAGSVAGTNICFLGANACTIDNFYNGFTIHNDITSEDRTIVSYIGSTRQCTLNAVWNGTVNNSYHIDNIYLSHTISDPTPPYGEERKIYKHIAGDGIFSSDGTSFTLNTNDNTDFTGCFITDNNSGDTRYISTYNSSTKTGDVSPPWGGAFSNHSYVIRTIFIASPFSVSPSIGFAYEIEGFSYDNWNPFSYIGSLVSSQEMVCYEVELMNLTLPNTVLKSGKGGRSIFYPYFYVELQNISAPTSRSDNIIYSNNPHSTKILFRALLNDTTTLDSSPFIKIDGDGMRHVMKFRPNDSFKFSVRDTDGNIFETEEMDRYSPSAPNPMVQISACFSFKRI